MKTQKHSFFKPFNTQPNLSALPGQFILSGTAPHALCKLAVTELQAYLNTQKDWEHNFGLQQNHKGAVIGKMFGVLVVKNTNGLIGYLAAFSGKLAGGNKHAAFVPAVFDALDATSFLNNGMAELKNMSAAIKAMEMLEQVDQVGLIQLKNNRKKHSVSLQQQLFNNYHFINGKGLQKSLIDLFNAAGYRNPPAGAGECAAPKLLQYAFQQHMQPLAIAEFWWGLSPKSAQWKHGHFYPCCKEKCAPILAHMLEGI